MTSTATLLKTSREDLNDKLVEYVREAAEMGEITKFGPEDAGRFVVVEDGTFAIGTLAALYAAQYDGNFSFMVEMREALRRWGSLSDGQLKGVLNCMLAEARRNAPKTETPKDESAVIDAPAVCNVAVVVEGTFTLVGDSGNYRTLRIKTAGPNSNLAGKRIASFLSGPDNESSYSGFAFVNDDGSFKVWKRFADNQSLTSALRALLTGDMEAAGMAYALESGNCYRCGRKLTVPASINRGLGPDCAGKV